MKHAEEPIDVVITWVDGRDPIHQSKKAQFLNQKLAQRDDLGGDTRYNSVGEIYYCVASILRNASFVRRIFIITDGQKPDLDLFINENFPNHKVEIKIIDHTEIFRDFEEYLPTFNSLSIETMLYRIPGLSENFIYFNDDFFVLRPTEPRHFFRNGKAVAYGSWKSFAADQLMSKLKPLVKGRKTFGFKDSMLNAAKVLHKKDQYFRIQHTPLPLKKSILENYFNNHPDVLRSNIKHKFRSHQQFNPQALFYLLAEKEGAILVEKTNRELLIKPPNKPLQYAIRKRKTFENNKQLLFCCVESADQTSDEVRNYLFGWFSEILKIKV